MPAFIDARIPLHLLAADAPLAAETALLRETGAIDARAAASAMAIADFSPDPTADHAAGCACCLPRGAVAMALARLFLARVRGEVGFFTAVAALPASEAGAAAIRDALARDPLIVGRYRLVEESG